METKVALVSNSTELIVDEAHLASEISNIFITVGANF